jgi:hypothetical protein
MTYIQHLYFKHYGLQPFRETATKSVRGEGAPFQDEVREIAAAGWAGLAPGLRDVRRVYFVNAANFDVVGTRVAPMIARHVGINGACLDISNSCIATLEALAQEHALGSDGQAFVVSYDTLTVFSRKDWIPFKPSLAAWGDGGGTLTLSRAPVDGGLNLRVVDATVHYDGRFSEVGVFSPMVLSNGNLLLKAFKDMVLTFRGL